MQQWRKGEGLGVAENRVQVKGEDPLAGKRRDFVYMYTLILEQQFFITFICQSIQ